MGASEENMTLEEQIIELLTPLFSSAFHDGSASETDAAKAVVRLLRQGPTVGVSPFDDGDGTFVYGKNFTTEDAVTPGAYALVLLDEEDSDV